MGKPNKSTHTHTCSQSYIVLYVHMHWWRWQWWWWWLCVKVTVDTHTHRPSNDREAKYAHIVKTMTTATNEIHNSVADQNEREQNRTAYMKWNCHRDNKHTKHINIIYKYIYNIYAIYMYAQSSSRCHVKNTYMTFIKSKSTGKACWKCFYYHLQKWEKNLHVCDTFCV